MKYAIIDFFNLCKRYLPYIKEDEDIDIESSLNILTKIVDISKDYDLVLIATDSGRNKRANSILSGQYKANRNRAKTGSDNDGFIPYTKEILTSAGFPIISVKDTEADMIIHFIVDMIQIKDKKADITIYSNDTDFYQLLADNVSIIPWKKDKVTKDNWWQLDSKLKNTDGLDSRNYGIMKSIVGVINF